MRADLWPLDPQGELLLSCMVESEEGVPNCRAVASPPGVGGILVGPRELAFSLGVPFDDPMVEKAIQTVLATCKEVGVPSGTVSTDADVLKRLARDLTFCL